MTAARTPTCLRSDEGRKGGGKRRRRKRGREGAEGKAASLKKEGEAAGEGGEDKPGRNRRSCRRIVARTTVQCHLLSAVDAPFAEERTPPFPPRDSPASYKWDIAMQSSRPSLGIYPRLLLFGRIPVCAYRRCVRHGTSAKSTSNVLYGATARRFPVRTRRSELFLRFSGIHSEITIARH